MVTPSDLICRIQQECQLTAVGLVIVVVVVVVVTVVVVQYRNEEQSYTEKSARLKRKNTEV